MEVFCYALIVGNGYVHGETKEYRGMLSITQMHYCKSCKSHYLHDNGAYVQLGTDLFLELISQCFGGSEIE